MSQSNEANDYKIFKLETSARFPEDTIQNNIIKFNQNTNILEQKQHKTFNEVTYSFLKRTIDITASAAALLLLSPVFLATTLAIRKDSDGPAMFTQKRIGKDGKLFEIYKFRTMVPDADKKLFELLEQDEKAREEYKINKKLKNDPRITKVGNFLRKTSIDELPQLINVFKGNMSLVGPRPYLPREKEDMGEHYRYIINSKPGLTGLWQISGRSNTTFERRMQFDRQYNINKSLKTDVKILCKTVGVVFKGVGAA